MNRKQILSDKGYHIEKIQNDLFRQVYKYLNENNLTQTEFANKLGVTKGYVSQVLNGNFDFKISKLVELSLAIGMIPDISFSLIEEFDNKKKQIVRTKTLPVFIIQPRYKNEDNILSAKQDSCEAFVENDCLAEQVYN